MLPLAAVAAAGAPLLLPFLLRPLSLAGFAAADASLLLPLLCGLATQGIWAASGSFNCSWLPTVSGKESSPSMVSGVHDVARVIFFADVFGVVFPPPWKLQAFVLLTAKLSSLAFLVL